jgi:hypothetical protein
MNSSLFAPLQIECLVYGRLHPEETHSFAGKRDFDQVRLVIEVEPVNLVKNATLREGQEDTCY